MAASPARARALRAACVRGDAAAVVRDLAAVGPPGSAPVVAALAQDEHAALRWASYGGHPETVTACVLAYGGPGADATLAALETSRHDLLREASRRGDARTLAALLGACVARHAAAAAWVAVLVFSLQFQRRGPAACRTLLIPNHHPPTHNPTPPSPPPLAQPPTVPRAAPPFSRRWRPRATRRCGPPSASRRWTLSCCSRSRTATWAPACACFRPRTFLLF
jgi:hypothetical protein